MGKLSVLIGIVAAMLLLQVDRAAAQGSFNLSGLQACPLSEIGELGCPSNVADYVRTLAVGGAGKHGALQVFMGILFAMLIYYGIKLLVSSRNESAVAETKTAYGQAVVGAMLAGGATLLADTFAGNSGQLVNESSFNSTIGNAILFLKALLATVVLVNIVVQGVRLIAATDDGEIDGAKKRLLHGLIGAAFVILASTIVNAFYASPSPSNLTFEIAGMAQYALTLFGGLAVIGLIVAGIMLVVSVDESLKDRARKLILTSIVALAVVIVSYGLVTIFIGPASPP